MNLSEECLAANGTIFNFTYGNDSFAQYVEDQPDPFRWGFLMTLCVFAGLVFTYANLWETLIGFFHDPGQLFEDIRAFKQDLSKHPSPYNVDMKSGMSIWSAICQVFAHLAQIGAPATFFIYTVVKCNEKMSGGTWTYRPTIDGTAYLLMTWTFIYVVFARLTISAAAIWRYKSYPDPEHYETFHSVLVTGKAKHYVRGRQAKVTAGTRAWIIILNLFFWGGLPFALALQGVVNFAKTTSEGTDTLAERVVVPLVAALGLSFIAVFTYTINSDWFKLAWSDCWTPAIPAAEGVPTSAVNLLRVGHSSHVFGDRSFVRGEIQVQFMPTIFIMVWILAMAAGYTYVYQNVTQSLVASMITLVFPLFLTAYAQNNQWFIAYSLTATFWFYTLSYFWGIVNICYFNDQLMTLAPEDPSAFKTDQTAALTLSYLPAGIFTAYVFFYTVFQYITPNSVQGKGVPFSLLNVYGNLDNARAEDDRDDIGGEIDKDEIVASEGMDGSVNRKRASGKRQLYT